MNALNLPPFNDESCGQVDVIIRAIEAAIISVKASTPLVQAQYVYEALEQLSVGDIQKGGE